MNQYPAWRYVLITAVFLAGFLYALPNFYGDDPSLQITPRRAHSVDHSLLQKVQTSLKEQNIDYKSVELINNSLLLRFRDAESREKARLVTEQTVGQRQFIVALNTASATPDWLRDLGGKQMYMGLDLRGGVHFLMEVDMDAVRAQTQERFISELRTAFREEKIRYRSIFSDIDAGIALEFLNDDMKLQGVRFIEAKYTGLVPNDVVGISNSIRIEVRDEVLQEAQASALKQNIVTLRNRVNEFGVAEPVIQQQGRSRIVVQLPGVEDTAEAKKILGATATLEFRMVDMDNDVRRALDGNVPVRSKLFYERNGSPILLEKRVILTGEYVTDAASGIEQQTGSPAVFIELDGKGARIFSRATREQIGKPMAVVYIEQRKGRAEAEVINVATIRDELSKRFQITGLESTEEARTLALLLRAGALAAPIEIIEERTVGPSLGQENIDKGFRSIVIGLFGVLIFMALYYKVFGLVANVALTMNLVLIVALLSLLQATLTLPGIAGIVLTVGMAVDANVLIFQRIREELANGNSPHMSINSGYEKAFSTIADANVTTLIAAIVLFSFGTGPVRGFAVTLSLGIVTSMFTAIMGTRAIINLIYGRRQINKLLI